MIVDLHKHREHKNNCGNTMLDAYNYYKANGGEISIHQYRLIVSSVNDEIRNNISLGETFDLPFALGTISLRKKPKRFYDKDGKLKINMPIDWHNTIKLWEISKYARDNKQLVRFDCDYVYKLCYNVDHAICKNKRYYKFLPNRKLKQMLKENIDNGKTDAYLFCNNK